MMSETRYLASKGKLDNNKMLNKTCNRHFLVNKALN